MKIYIFLMNLPKRLEKRNLHICDYISIFTILYDYLNINLKNYLLDALNKIEEEIHLIDLNNCSFFDDSDFNHTDHLNFDGAIKATNILNGIIVDKLY